MAAVGVGGDEGDHAAACDLKGLPAVLSVPDVGVESSCGGEGGGVPLAEGEVAGNLDRGQIINSQMQCDGGVASVGGTAGEGVGVAVALGVGLPVPVEGTTGVGGGVACRRCLDDGVDGVGRGASGGGLGDGDGVEAVIRRRGVCDDGVLLGGVEAVRAGPGEGRAGVVGVGGELDGTALAG